MTRLRRRVNNDAAPREIRGEFGQATVSGEPSNSQKTSIRAILMLVPMLRQR
jgi:hypothetical protein